MGRDASPDPLAVNQVAWEVNKALMCFPETYFLVGAGLGARHRAREPWVCGSPGCALMHAHARLVLALFATHRHLRSRLFARPMLGPGPPFLLLSHPHPLTRLPPSHAPRPLKIHCTHGFNRTGYIIASVMMRLLSPTGMCVERAVRRFAQQRPPGIYKHEYIEDLFR